MSVIGIEKKDLEDLCAAVEQAKAASKSVTNAGYETLGNIATVWAILDDGTRLEGQIRFLFDGDSTAAATGAGADQGTDQLLRMIVSWLERALA